MRLSNNWCFSLHWLLTPSRRFIWDTENPKNHGDSGHPCLHASRGGGTLQKGGDTSPLPLRLTGTACTLPAPAPHPNLSTMRPPFPSHRGDSARCHPGQTTCHWGLVPHHSSCLEVVWLGPANDRCPVFLAEETLEDSPISASGWCCDAQKVAATLFPAQVKPTPFGADRTGKQDRWVQVQGALNVRAV